MLELLAHEHREIISYFALKALPDYLLQAQEMYQYSSNENSSERADYYYRCVWNDHILQQGLEGNKVTT